MMDMWRQLGARKVSESETTEAATQTNEPDRALREAADRLNHEYNALGAAYPQLADFMCPFDKRVMIDPVRAADGFVYDRANIEAFIGGNLSGWQAAATSELAPSDIVKICDEVNQERGWVMRIPDDTLRLLVVVMGEIERLARDAVGIAPLTVTNILRAIPIPENLSARAIAYQERCEADSALCCICRSILVDVGKTMEDDAEMTIDHLKRWLMSSAEYALWAAVIDASADVAGGSTDAEAGSTETGMDPTAALFEAAKRARRVVISPKTKQEMGTTLSPEVDLKASIFKLLARIAEDPSAPVEAALSLEWEPRGAQRETRRVEIALTEGASGPGAADLSIALSKVFRTLDIVRPLMRSVLDGWEPPKVVVIGDESVGKSTILEQLCQLPLFPRKRRFCTKLAVVVRLRRWTGPEEAPQTVTMSVRAIDSGELLEQHLIPMENSFFWVQEKMQALVDEAAKTSGSGVVSDKELVLDVRHPSVPSIDLVDLPGLVSADRQRPERPEHTRAILRRQVEQDTKRGGNSFYVAIVPASGDLRPSTNGAMEFICDSDLVDKTFGVFSKCDQVADSDILRSVMLGVDTADGDKAGDMGYIELKRGWVASMLKPPAPANYFDNHNFERLLKQKQDEDAYFGDSEDEIIRELHAQNLCGVGALVSRLEAQYNDYLHTTWKRGTILKILEKGEDLRFQRSLLGAALKDGGDQLARKEAARRLADPSIYRAAMVEVSAWGNSDLLRIFEGQDGTFIRAERIDLILEKFAESIDAGVSAVLDKASLAWLKKISSVLTGELKAQPSGHKPKEGIVNCMFGLFSAGATYFLFHQSASRREITETIEKQQIVQLANFKGFTNDVVEKCRVAFNEAKRKIKEDVHALVFNLTFTGGLSPHFVLEPTDSLDGVVVKLPKGGKFFVDKLLTIVMRHLPSSKTLATSIADVTLGEESDAAVGRRNALDKEINDVERALQGVVEALEIGNEELDAFRSNHARVALASGTKDAQPENTGRGRPLGDVN